MSEPTDLNASSAPENSAQAPQNQDPYAALVLPENSSISPCALDALKKQAADMKLPLPTLQTWIEQEHIRLQQQAQQQAQARQEQRRAWAQQTQQRWGANWQEEVSRAVRAADVFGGPELRQLLEETGLGNHPAIVGAFAAVGKRIAEDVSLAGTSLPTADKTFSQALYAKQ